MSQEGGLLARLKTRAGISIVTWAVGGTLVLVLLFAVGSLSDTAFLWSTVACTFIRKQKSS